MYVMNIIFIFVIISAEIAIIVNNSGGIPAIVTFPVSLLFVVSNMIIYRSILNQK